MKKIYISLPKRGVFDEEAKDNMKDVAVSMEKHLGEPIEILSCFIEESAPEGVNLSLWNLSKNLMLLSEADAVVFWSGWAKSRVCMVEFDCAWKYGIPIFKWEESKLTVKRISG